ncbi:hypothetical protein TGAM01_v205682 [Trichoderma gamsii]|uniref:Uncharacterized protein n=1 Tax=Trichoderma gamsii TaxID=398673 RepID=A0A2P4ZM79_9HYPO|nr:hypothetical protein TGAM01_v205682 [Trichoderma gamsii]
MIYVWLVILQCAHTYTRRVLHVIQSIY